MKKPNFFIVGMPRAGTTSLHHYLAQHPEICMAQEKEPHFFGSDLTPGTAFFRVDKDGYLALFSHAADEKILGEASVEYLISTKAAEEIYHFSPEAKILISLRNPVDQCYSYYYKHRLQEIEPIRDFTQAINDTRRVPIPPSWFRESFFYKRNIKNLPENIRRFIKIFGIENVKIIFFDDLQNSPAVVYKDILSFLEVNPNFSPKFKIYNANHIARIDLLNRWYRKIFFFKKISRLKRNLKQLPLQNMKERLYKLIIKPAQRPQLARELRERLTKEFLPVIEELEKLTGRNLSSWKMVS